ncbi:MAG: hypothetical protein EHM47_03985 [Ignavibacteriales bacterium]|nr:MAG: hypothetical protein EHM47_03985 [Ignavibacteriales bacterium]
MKQSLILWSSALFLTFISGYIRSGISEYYPVTGTIGIDEKKVSYRFEKKFNDKGNYTFIIRTDTPDIEAVVKWKQDTEKDWKVIEMTNEQTALTADIPRLDAGGTILYFAEIIKDNKKYIVPDKPVALLFQGSVPGMISFLGSFALFGGLLFSFRTGLEFFNENQKIKKLTLFTAVFFFVYTIAVTPLRKSYELNAINKTVVPITSLFDTQSILILLTWIAAMVVVFKLKNPKPAVMFFAVFTTLVFLFT